MASGTKRQVLFITSLSIGWLLLVYGLPGTGSSIALPLLSSVCLSVYLLGCLSVCQSKPNTNKNQLNTKKAFKILKERLYSDFVFYFENLFMQSTSLQYNNLKEQTSGQVIKFFVYNTQWNLIWSFLAINVLLPENNFNLCPKVIYM